MSNDFQTLRATIETKLNTVSQLATVIAYHTGNIDGFPCATFEPSGNTAELFTNDDNLRRYSFDIIIHQEMKRAGRDKAVDILTKAVDAILTAFDEDFNLGGDCDFCFALPSQWGEYTGDNGAVKYAQITLVCNKEVTVVS
jgi:hypothetical protein